MHNVSIIVAGTLVLVFAGVVSAEVSDAELERLAMMAEAIDDRAERTEDRLATAVEQGRWRRGLATYIEEEHRKARAERETVERGLRDLAKAEQTAMTVGDVLGITAGGGAILTALGLGSVGVKRACCGQHIWSGRPKEPPPHDDRRRSSRPTRQAPDRSGEYVTNGTPSGL